MRTSICVDGFNLTAIKYFTAPVSGKSDPRRPVRQQAYWRALQAWIPELTLYRGTFLTHPVTWPLLEPIDGRRYAAVLKTEEKGSDVNLAVHLLNDAWIDAYDCAVVFSNDSDLAEAMRLVRQHHSEKKLGLVFPRRRGRPSQELVNHAHFVKHLGSSVLAGCQLPSPVPGTRLRKPQGW